MPDFSRRDFARLAGVCGAGALAAAARPRFALAQASAKVVIVGGGAGGATAARLTAHAPAMAAGPQRAARRPHRAGRAGAELGQRNRA